jgi:hypothetical protein
MRQNVLWVIVRLCDEEAEEESLMSGASSGWGLSYTYYEDVEEIESDFQWED